MANVPRIPESHDLIALFRICLLLHWLSRYSYEGVAVFTELRTASHVVYVRYITAAPDDFFSEHSIIVSLFRCFDDRSPSRPVRRQCVSLLLS